MGKLVRVVVFLVGLALLATPAAAARSKKPDEFRVATNRFWVNQAPAWTPDGKGIVYYKRVDAEPGQRGPHLFRARLDGAGETCLTCGQPGSNQFAHYHPSGRWIMFHSNRGKTFQLFAPGGGGIGSDIYAMRPDGSQPVALTKSPEGQDNFHAYFSPDGKRLAWTHINWAINEGGTGYWDVRVADFVETPDGPKLENVKVILPPNGDFYETQHWSPDSRGFLVTRSRDNAMNLELHFLNLRKSPPVLTRLTENPSWDEQAIFTPDGRKVIFMSTRDHPSNWESFAHVSRTVGAPTGFDHLLTAALFATMFNSPFIPPSTDLHELDLKTRKLRRLTRTGDEGWIIPEFSWDRKGKRLLWTELRWPETIRASAPLDPVAEFEDVTGPENMSDIERAIRGLSAGRPAEASERRTRIGYYVKPRRKKRR